MTFHPPDLPSTIAFLVIVVAVLAMVLWGTRVAAARAGEDAMRATRAVAITLAVWVAITSLPPATGIMRGAVIPALPLFFVTVLAGGVVFAFSRHGTRLARNLPLAALVAFQAFRLPLELVLHSWAEQGSIPATMTWTGQNYDIAAGVLAIVMAPLVVRAPFAARIFNWIGAALLLNVLRVVVMSSPLPFAWNVEPPLLVGAFAPYHLIATVCVAAALAGHIILLRALAPQRR
jgi:hypothetical protein